MIRQQYQACGRTTAHSPIRRRLGFAAVTNKPEPTAPDYSPPAPSQDLSPYSDVDADTPVAPAISGLSRACTVQGQACHPFRPLDLPRPLIQNSVQVTTSEVPCPPSSLSLPQYWEPSNGPATFSPRARPNCWPP